MFRIATQYTDLEEYGGSKFCMEDVEVSFSLDKFWLWKNTRDGIARVCTTENAVALHSYNAFYKECDFDAYTSFIV